jgi:choline dehydrogenase-like flavoprotein
VGYDQLTRRNLRRSSSSKAYLDPVRRRLNLAVTTGAQVLRIVVE